MPTGMQIFTSDGHIIMDTADRLCKIIEQFTESTGGIFSKPIQYRGNASAFVIPLTSTANNSERPVAWIDGNTLHWQGNVFNNVINGQDNYYFAPATYIVVVVEY